MKLLHTSDWHLGRTLYGKKRHEEFEAFLDWLAETIEKEKIDILLVAGDIFDTSTPGNQAQSMYYRFLCRISKSECRHVVVIAGNHDSPSFLNAPKELLRALDVHVIGCISENLADEVLVLCDFENKPELIVCAVPYLRDGDVRSVEAMEGIEDKQKKLLEGIQKHYQKVGEIALQKRHELGSHLPIIGMGHLFTAGGQILDGDGVRELYVGSLAHINAKSFPVCFDYLALGHLHVPQAVKGTNTIRYSGSPLPMGFGEAKQTKSVCLIKLQDQKSLIDLIEIPVFQHLEQIKGNWNTVENRLEALKKKPYSIWLEIIYEGKDLTGDLRERLEHLVQDSNLEILRIKNNRLIETALGQMHAEESLDELDIFDVFERCLTLYEIPSEQKPLLAQTYREALTLLEKRKEQE